MINIIRGSILKGISEIISKAASLIFIPLMINFIGAEGYGAYAQMGTIVGFIVPFATFGISSAIVRYFSAPEWSNSTRGNFFKITFQAMIISGVFSAFFFIASSTINHYFLKWDQGGELFRCGAFLLFLGCFDQIILNFFRARQWYGQMGFYEILQVALSTLLAYLVLSAGKDLIYFLVTLIGIRICMSTLFFTSLWIWNKPSNRINPAISEKIFFSMVTYGMPLTVANLGIWFMNFGDRLVIGGELGAKALAQYGVMYGLVFILMAVNSPILLTVYPRLIKQVEIKNYSQMRAEIKIYSRIIALFIIPSMALMLILIDPTMIYLGGEGLRVDFIVILLIVLSVGIDQLNGVTQYVLMSHDKQNIIQFSWISFGIINLILNLLLVPIYGLLGSAIATFCTTSVVEIIFIITAKKLHENISLFNLISIAKSLSATILAYIACAPTIGDMQERPSNIIFYALAFLTIYTAILIKIGELKLFEIRNILNALVGK